MFYFICFAFIEGYGVCFYLGGGGACSLSSFVYYMSYYYKISEAVEKRNKYIHESFEDFPTSCVYKNVYEIYLTEGPLIEVTLIFFT